MPLAASVYLKSEYILAKRLANHQARCSFPTIKMSWPPSNSAAKLNVVHKIHLDSYCRDASIVGINFAKQELSIGFEFLHITVLILSMLSTPQ